MYSEVYSASATQSRRGFSLVAILVAILAVAVIAAAAIAVTTSAEDEIDAGRVASLFQSLDSSLRKNTANAQGDRGYCPFVRICPIHLSDLVIRVAQGDTACGDVYSSAEANRWANRAPYSGLEIVPGVGVNTPFGVVHDSIIRLSTTSFELHLDSVSVSRANYLDLEIDGVANAGAGILQYVASPGVLAGTGQSLYLVKYIVSGTNVSCP